MYFYIKRNVYITRMNKKRNYLILNKAQNKLNICFIIFARLLIKLEFKVYGIVLEFFQGFKHSFKLL